MSLLQATCVMKVKLVEVSVITYISAVHHQWKWYTHTRKTLQKLRPPQNCKFSHSQRRAASLENSSK